MTTLNNPQNGCPFDEPLKQPECYPWGKVIAVFAIKPPDSESISESNGEHHFWKIPDEIIEGGFVPLKNHFVSTNDPILRKFTADNWPNNFPDYNSPEGWELEKLLKRKQLIALNSTIPWLLSKGSDKHLLIINRLYEILCHN